MNLTDLIQQEVLTNLASNMHLLPTILLVSIAIVFYSATVWMFYKILAKKEIVQLNLAQYNNSENETIKKIGAVLMYIIEFLFLSPLLITLWFFVFVILLLLLAKEQSGQAILIISASFIAATRICAYYNEDLSNDLAKMFPFTLLGIAVSNPNFFNFSDTITKLFEVGKLINQTAYFIFFMFAVEIILRILTIFKSKEETPNKDT